MKTLWPKQCDFFRNLKFLSIKQLSISTHSTKLMVLLASTKHASATSYPFYLILNIDQMRTG